MEYDSNYLLIIGNGFDRSLGLKTSYEDFFKSDNYKSLNKNNGLIKHLDNARNIHKWIDLETEIRNYSARFNETKRLVKHPDFPDNTELDKTIFRDLIKALHSYLDSIEYHINLKSPAYKLIESIITKPGPKTILDFNYTKSVEKIIQDKPSNALSHVKIHGSIETNNIIVGVEDEAKGVDNFYKKAYPPFYPGIKVSKYLDKAFQEIIFFGYSLGETDHSYFKDFFSSRSRRTSDNDPLITIYYHNMNAADALNDELVKLTDSRLLSFKSLNSFVMKNVSDMES